MYPYITKMNLRFFVSLYKAYRRGGKIYKRSDPRYIFKVKMWWLWIAFKANYKRVLNEVLDAIIIFSAAALLMLILLII